MLRIEDALKRLDALGAPRLPVERVPLEDADGRVIVEDVVCSDDLPGFDYSSMDGYALRASELTDASPLRLPVRGESKTGAVPDALTTGSVMRIFTGAPLPDGADTVVMQENVTRDGDVAVLATRPRAGQHVRRRGDDIRAGDVAIREGTRLRPVHLALAAALDLADLPVAARPEVAILATGDELRRPGAAPRAGMIPESNTVMLCAMARRAGARARVLPYVRDDRSATERAFAAAVEEADVVVTVGGVSVGDHDIVRPALEAVGVSLEFWRVAMKPGKPLTVGRFSRSGRRDAVVLGLPGNPASAMVTFALFGVPLLRTLQGDRFPGAPLQRARTTHAYAHAPGRVEFVRANHGWGVFPDGIQNVTPLDNQASGAATTMAKANALIVIPAEANGIAQGEDVDVMLLSELCG